MESGHQTPSNAGNAYAAEIPYPSHAEAARTLVAKSKTAVLSTLEHQLGYPYSAVSEVLPLANGDVIVFVSSLAEHTIHLQRDPRAALLYSEGLGLENPLAHPRLSMMGKFEWQADRNQFRAAYLELHPLAARYIDFQDFDYYRFMPERVRFIGGFGRMGWLDAEQYRAAQPDPLWKFAPGILEHMNCDHAQNILDYAQVYANADWAQSARMLGIDRLGFDLEARGEGKLERLRIGFETPLETSEDAHQALVKLARAARSKLAQAVQTE